MVALALSMLVLTAATILTLSSQRSGRQQQQLRSLDEGARWALSVIGNEIRHAGFGAVDLSLPLDRAVTFTGAPVSGCDGAVSDVATALCAGNKTGTDALVIRYQRIDGAASSSTDCNGRSIPTTRAEAADLFHVVDGTLRCRGSDGPSAEASTSEPLLDNVEDLQFTYAVAKDDAATDATQQLYARAMAAADWSRVVGVRICLIVMEPGPVASPAAEPYTYRDCSGVLRQPGDGRIRRLFVNSFALRNRTG